MVKKPESVTNIKKPKKRTTTAFRKGLFIKCFHEALGILSVACKKSGVSKDTYYHWLKTDDDFRKKIEEAPEIALDYAEGCLFSDMKRHKTAATIFYLKTKGRCRGYIERQEININTDDITKLSDEDLRKIVGQE